MDKQPMKLAIFVAEWGSGDYERRFMACVAPSLDEALAKFRVKWETMYKGRDSKFVTEIDMEPYDTIGTYVTEHGIDEVVEYTEDG